MPVDFANTLTIEQLAAESGMTVRNIRSHQARGLLAPPEVRLRIGYYGPEHVHRLKLIRDLQSEGFNLNGIKRLLDGDDGTDERMTRFRRALTTSYDEQPEHVTLGELAQRFRLSAADARIVLARAEQLGILVPDGAGGYDVPSPSLLAVAEEVARRGISLQDALDVFAALEEHADAVAKAFVQLFVRDVWRPFQRADMPPERWAEIDESIARLRPLASGALLAIFQARMRSQIEAAFGDGTERVVAR